MSKIKLIESEHSTCFMQEGAVLVGTIFNDDIPALLIALLEDAGAVKIEAFDIPKWNLDDDAVLWLISATDPS